MKQTTLCRSINVGLVLSLPDYDESAIKSELWLYAVNLEADRQLAEYERFADDDDFALEC